jgi:hypothetical protein
MQLWQKALALSTCCLVLTAASCEPKRVVTSLPIPPERMDCVYVQDRPTIPAEHVIDWSKVTTVPQARSEHDAYVRSVRNREGIVAGYIVNLEGKLFACSNDDAWLREWNATTSTP